MLFKCLHTPYQSCQLFWKATCHISRESMPSLIVAKKREKVEQKLGTSTSKLCQIFFAEMCLVAGSTVSSYLPPGFHLRTALGFPPPPWLHRLHLLLLLLLPGWWPPARARRDLLCPPSYGLWYNEGNRCYCQQLLRDASQVTSSKGVGWGSKKRRYLTAFLLDSQGGLEKTFMKSQSTYSQLPPSFSPPAMVEIPQGGSKKKGVVVVVQGANFTKSFLRWLNGCAHYDTTTS